MPREACFCTAPRNVCPSQSVPPLGGRQRGLSQPRTVIRAHPRSQRAVGEAFCPAGATQTLALSGRCSVSEGSPASLASVGTLAGPGEGEGQVQTLSLPREEGKGRGIVGEV